MNGMELHTNEKCVRKVKEYILHVGRDVLLNSQVFGPLETCVR